jgi:hypothetical protein
VFGCSGIRRSWVQGLGWGAALGGVVREVPDAPKALLARSQHGVNQFHE